MQENFWVKIGFFFKWPPFCEILIFFEIYLVHWLTKDLNFKKLFDFFVSDACVRSKKSGRLTYQIWTCRKSALINQNIIDVSVWKKFVLYSKSTLINHKSFGKIRYFFHPQKNPKKYSNFRAVRRDPPLKNGTHEKHWIQSRQWHALNILI